MKTPPPIGPFTLPSFAELASSGIYFLHLNDEVVYVGQARIIRQRIGQHISEGVKDFDSVSAILCAVEHLDVMERRYISLLLPRYNRCILARESKTELELRGITLSQPPIVTGNQIEDEMAARALGISVDEMREHQRLGHGPEPVLRSRNGRHRYPAGVLRKFAARHLSAPG